MKFLFFWLFENHIELKNSGINIPIFHDADLPVHNPHRGRKFTMRGMEGRGKEKKPFSKKGFHFPPSPVFSFTLIELLVVIAVIAVLAGMLLPALGRVKDRSHTMQCVSNQKQIALVAQVYMNDFQYFPDKMNTASYSTNWKNAPYPAQFVTTYKMSYKLTVCPAVLKPYDQLIMDPINIQGNMLAVGYPLTGLNTSLLERRQEKIRRPSRVVLSGDCGSDVTGTDTLGALGSRYFQYVGGVGNGRLVQRHEKYYVLVLSRMDGSALSMRTDLPGNMETGRNRIYDPVYLGRYNTTASGGFARINPDSN